MTPVEWSPAEDATRLIQLEMQMFNGVCSVPNGLNALNSPAGVGPVQTDGYVWCSGTQHLCKRQVTSSAFSVSF